MEKYEPEETQPNAARPEPEEAFSQLENTMPAVVKPAAVQAGPQQPEETQQRQDPQYPADPQDTAELEQTRRVSVHSDEFIANGDDAIGDEVARDDAAFDDEAFEQTIPPPVSLSQPPIEPDDTVFAVPYAGDVAESGNPPPPPVPSGRPFPLGGIAVLGVIALLAIGALAAFGGYQSGISSRTAAGATQSAAQVQEQFNLGIQDIEARRFDLARQRFEYVIQLDPGYPGVTEKLAEVLLSMQSTATPTVAPTPTITPTPDLRNVEERFAQAQQSLTNGDWTAAIETLLSLRKADPNHQPVQVDGMLYIAYRNRGSDKILKNGDLEGGIYDLTQAEQIGPLDADAKSYLTWASLYKTGASFWEIDWAQALYYFAQIYPALPNLRDGSGWTATERYRLALIGYGDFLAENGDFCTAVEQFDLALEMGEDAQVEEARNNAADECDGGDERSSDESSSGSDVTVTEAPPTEPPATVPPPTEPPATEPPPTEPPATEPPATEPPPANNTPTP